MDTQYQQLNQDQWTSVKNQYFKLINPDKLWRDLAKEAIDTLRTSLFKDYMRAHKKDPESEDTQKKKRLYEDWNRISYARTPFFAEETEAKK